MRFHQRCTCTAWTLRAVIAASSGVNRSAVAFNAPCTVPSATSNPHAANDLTIRWTGRPSTHRSYSSLARNPGVNRDLLIFWSQGLAGVAWFEW
jgi:hypothetical protein